MANIEILLGQSLTVPIYCLFSGANKGFSMSGLVWEGDFGTIVALPKTETPSVAILSVSFLQRNCSIVTGYFLLYDYNFTSFSVEES